MGGDFMSLRRIALVFFCCMTFCGCSAKRGEEMVYEEAARIVTAFEEKDMEEINDILFADRETGVEKRLVDSFGFDDKEDDDSILSRLFQKVFLKIKKIDKSEITYIVAAPDMANFFLDNQSDMVEMNQEQLRGYFLEYMESAPIKERSIKVNYKIDDGNFAAEYKNKEFINAVTGDLLESYTKLYEQMLKEYRESFKEGETH